MTPPLYALVGFALWTLLLVFAGIGAWRVKQVVVDKRRPNSFPSGQPHGPDWYQRMNRAHMNCVENLPIFASLVLVGHVAGVRDPTFDTLALAYFGARIGQTLAHLSSGRSLVVNIRFTFFLAQVICAAWMGWILLRAG